MARTRVFLVDDEPELLARLREALATEFSVVGVAGSGEQLLREAPELCPHVVILDVSLPGMSGIEAAEHLKTRLPEVRVVVLSMHADEEYVTEAFRVGASAYVLKTSGVRELARAIHEVAAGNDYRSPRRGSLDSD